MDYAPSNLNRCNHTELFQLCRRAEIPVLPNYPRELLIALLEGTTQPTPVDHPTDRWRDALMAFVNDYYVKLRSQLDCPAKSRDPKACYGCVDTQVYTCLATNESSIGLIEESYIQLRRKKQA